MKVYLHGPRAGKSCKLQGVKFIDGVAEVFTLSNILSRYYNVKDFPPEDLNQGEENVQENATFTNDEHEENVDKDENILRELVESKKEELNKEKPDVKDWKAMPWWTAKAYVKEKTGKSPKDKKSAMAIMKEAGFE